jgi:flagellar protein FlaJ
MKFSDARRKLDEILQNIINRIPHSASITQRISLKEVETNVDNRKLQFFAYRVLGNKINFFLPLFQDLEAGLHKSNMKITLKPYVSLIILSSLLASSILSILVFTILRYVILLNTSLSLLFGIGLGLITCVLTIICLYAYPYYKSDKVRRSLDSSMAFTASYMAILAGSGVPPDSMFRSLSRIPQKLAIVEESRTIVRDIELFGADTITALEQASQRTSSDKFKELLEGFISTIRSGGNLKSYLMIRSRQNLRSKRLALQKFSDTLGVLSEFYVTLLVAGPLIFVVMLAVMAMLGGGGLGFMDPTLMLLLLTYIAIPVGSLIFIIVLDALSPR